MVDVSYKLLVSLLAKLAQKKSVLGWTDRLDMTIVFDRGIKNQNKQN